jgi:hypothetical protein
MLWAAALAMLMDDKLRAAAIYFLVAGACALFGIIHSPLADEQIGLPYQIMTQVPERFQQAVAFQTPYHWAASYALMALLLWGLALLRPESEAPPAPRAATDEPEEGPFTLDRHSE